jgi:hypothetical protein
MTAVDLAGGIAHRAEPAVKCIQQLVGLLFHIDNSSQVIQLSYLTELASTCLHDSTLSPELVAKYREFSELKQDSGWSELQKSYFQTQQPKQRLSRQIHEAISSQSLANIVITVPGRGCCVRGQLTDFGNAVGVVTVPASSSKKNNKRKASSLTETASTNPNSATSTVSTSAVSTSTTNGSNSIQQIVQSFLKGSILLDHATSVEENQGKLLAELIYACNTIMSSHAQSQQTADTNTNTTTINMAPTNSTSTNSG